MKLLLTNDDGIGADGLAVLERAMSTFGSTTIVAPEGPLSGCSHQVTTDRDLLLHDHGAGRYAIDGTPADCTRLGLLHLAADVDWVVAGVNAGGNLGVDIYMSGTVAAVREASLYGKPAIAFSQYRARKGQLDWEAAHAMTVDVFRQLLEQPLAFGEYWNVNFPDLLGDKRTPTMVQCYPDPSPLEVAYENSDDRYRYCGIYQKRERLVGSDVDMCFQGHIAATRLSGVLTSST